MSKKENYIIFNPEGGLGKIIASTAMIKHIKKNYPEHKIIVLSPWAEVYLNNPDVYRVYKNYNTPYFYRDYIEGRESVVLKGEPYFQTGHIYQKQHLIKSWCDLFNLEFDGDVNPKLYFNSVENDLYADNLKQSDKPILVFQTNGGPYEDEKPYCWTRDFPFEQAQILTNELCKNFNVLQIGKEKCKRLENASFVEKIDNKRTMLSILLRSTRRILIDSCMQHAAAAFQLPSTVCWVGTKPEVFGYDIHTNITPNLPAKNDPILKPDAQFFDFDFNGPEFEYPYESNDLFNLQSIFDSVIKDH